MRTQVLVGVFMVAMLVGAGSPTSPAVADTRVPSQPAAPPGSSPKSAVQEFCRLDGEGGQLTEEGWRAIASLFVAAGKRPDYRSPSSSSTVIVSTQRSIEDVRLSDDGLAATVSTMDSMFGVLDRGLARYTPTDRGGVGGLGIYRLTKTATRGWRIDGPVPKASLTVETAIRELEALRSRTTDAELKRNATQSLKVLRMLLRDKQ